MGLVITTAAESKSLVTVAQVKSHTGISDSYDTLLASLVDEASQVICDYIGTDLAQQTYTETIPGSGSNRIILSRIPIVSVTSATKDGTAYTDYSVLDKYAGILYRADGWTEDTVSTLGASIDPEHRLSEPDWVFVYEAGYAIPSGTEPAGDEFELPASLKLYTIKLVASLFRERAGVDPRIKKRSIGGADGMSEEFFGAQDMGASGMPLDVERALNGWKRF